jgi:hypothetical protein
LIATNHDCIDYQELATWASLIVDTRNAMAGIPVGPGSVEGVRSLFIPETGSISQDES